MSGPLLLVLPTLSRGGAERVFVDLAGGLTARGHDVHLAWASGDAELAPSVTAAVTRHELGRARTATAIPRLRRLVDDLRPQVVLAALFHANMLAAAATRGRRARPGLVFTEHVELGPLLTTAPRRLARWSPRLIPAAYRLADAVVAVSGGVARDLAELGHLPAPLIHRIPNPIDLDRIARLAAEPPGDLRVIGSDRDAKLVLAAGRLEPVKGFDTLVRSLAAAEGSPRLVVLGEGSERAPLEALAAELGVADRVELPGAVANPYPLMARADVVVSSSRTEALPTVLIEALHLGRPVVATDCSAGVREITEDGALARLVPVDRPQALARALTDVLRDGPSAPKRTNAMARYGVDEVSARYEALIAEIS